VALAAHRDRIVVKVHRRWAKSCDMTTTRLEHWSLLSAWVCVCVWVCVGVGCAWEAGQGRRQAGKEAVEAHRRPVSGDTISERVTPPPVSWCV
jgi:hypothetical protein